MTHDEVSKACVPTSIRGSKPFEMDAIYNAAHTHLRDSDPGVVRQMEACIRAIQDERARQYADTTRKISVTAIILSFLVPIILFVLNRCL